MPQPVMLKKLKLNGSMKTYKTLLPGRKVMTNLGGILKSRDITLPTKVCLVKAMVFPVVMYGCESWTIKKAECGGYDAFELWCWRKLLRVHWVARRSNQSVLKEISPGCSLEGLMLKLKLQYFGHLMPRADSLEKTLMRSYPTPEVRGGGREEQPHVQGAAAARGGLRGATPYSRSGGVAMRRYPSSKVRSSGCTLLEHP